MTVEEGDPPPAGVRVPPPPVTLKVTVIPFIPTPSGVLTLTAGGVVTVPPSGALWPEVGAAPVSKPRVSTVPKGLNFLAVPARPPVPRTLAAESEAGIRTDWSACPTLPRPQLANALSEALGPRLREALEQSRKGAAASGRISIVFGVGSGTLCATRSRVKSG